MVSSVNGIYQSMLMQGVGNTTQNSSQSSSNVASGDFSSLLGIDDNSEVNSKDDFISRANSQIGTDGTQDASSSSQTDSTSSSSSEDDDKMDLNKDGKVTIDEMMRYMAMQMQQNMSDSLSSHMDNQNNLSENSFGSAVMKTATNAYQTAMNFASELASSSFDVGL